MPADRHLPVDGLDDVARYRRRLPGSGEAGEHEHELVAAHPRDRIRLPDAFMETIRDLHEKHVADVVAERVVDLFERIEIEEHDGCPRIRASGGGDGLFQTVVEERAARKPGQGVMRGHIAQFQLHSLALGHFVREFRVGRLEFARSGANLLLQTIAQPEKLRFGSFQTRDLLLEMRVQRGDLAREKEGFQNFRSRREND